MTDASHSEHPVVDELPLDARRIRAIFDQAAVGMTMLDDAGRIVAANAAFAAIVGRSAETLRGVLASTLSPPEEGDVTRQPVRDLRAGRRTAVTVEKRFWRPDGEIRWGVLTLSRTAIPATDGRGGIGVGIVGIVHDITPQKRLEAQAAHDAAHDRLTGLANRATLHARIAAALARAVAAGRPHAAVALLLLDVDHFTAVNEALGAAVGDALLTAIGERLTAATRGCDTVARVGDDAFAVLLTGMDAPGDLDVVVARVTGALRAPFALALGRAHASGPETPGDGRTDGWTDGRTDVRVGVSVGVAHAVGADGADDLLRQAAAALARAKALGRGRVEHAIDRADAPGHRPFAIEAGLRRALDRVERDGRRDGGTPAGAGGRPADGLWLAYQPIVELAGERIVGVEALARWSDPALGEVSPGDFIPVAEAAGLCVPLGWWVLDTACAQLAAWDAAGLPPIQMNVNVSAGQVQDAQLVDVVRDTLARHGLTPPRLTLELTESSTPHDLEAARGRLLALRALGVQLALDDFGTGYGSLVYLERFPVHTIKIDRRFVAALAPGEPRDGAEGSGPTAEARRAAALARAVIALGETLGLATVAEGVETREGAEVLRRLGCARGQGWLFGRPVCGCTLATRLATVRATALHTGLHAGPQTSAMASPATAPAAARATSPLGRVA